MRTKRKYTGQELIDLKYRTHKNGAKQRNIPFLLTFEEWWNIWDQSGHWEERGPKKGQFVMSRYGDKGPYAVGNVFIQSQRGNHYDAAPWKKFTRETSWNKGLKGHPSCKRTWETILKMQTTKAIKNGKASHLGTNLRS